jgi:glycosyltransferase involved in cell wall biosynthesis
LCWWAQVLAGAGPGLSRLAALPNVRVEPAVAHDEVPRVLSGFDVGLIPFRLTALTAAVNPNKLYEYLAAGLPVVSTPFSPDVEADAAAVALAGTPPASSPRASASFRCATIRRSARAWESRASEIATAHDWNTLAKEFWARACG